MEKYIVHKKGDVVAERLKQRGGWIVAHLDQSIGWTMEDLIVEYEGREFVLMTYDEERELLPAVGVLCKPGVAESAARDAIATFLSALNWVSSGSIRIDMWTGGSHPFRSSNKGGMRYTAQFFRIHYLPTNLNEDQKLALALLREGDNLDYHHSGYSFLSYYKIINMIRRKGAAQKKWIASVLDELEGAAQERIAAIKANGEVVEDYLYHSCRCALAHAGVDATVNPDDVEEERRLSSDLRLIRSLAEYAIEFELGITSGQTVWKEHLYELGGFKELIGETLLAEIMEKDAVSRRQLVLPDQISIRQWCDKRYGVFENLELRTKAIRERVAVLECRSPDGVFAINLYLDFGNERFELDVENVDIGNDAGRPAIEYAIDYNEFFRDLIANGEVEIFSAKDGKFLGRKDANLPTNIDLGGTIDLFNNKIVELRDQLDAKADESPDDEPSQLDSNGE